MNANWYIYLLVNKQTGRTYVGSTTNPQRRLRQHNREIRGGARSTGPGAPHWSLHSYVEGFPNRSSACRWEKIVKSRARGVTARQGAMYQVALGFCPAGGRRSRSYVPPHNLYFIDCELLKSDAGIVSVSGVNAK